MYKRLISCPRAALLALLIGLVFGFDLSVALESAKAASGTAQSRAGALAPSKPGAESVQEGDAAACQLAPATPDVGIPACTRLISAGTNVADTLISRGTAFLVQGMTSEAITDIDQAIKLRPAYARGYYLRGRAYLARSDFDRAIENFGIAIKREKAPPPGYFIDRANALSSKGEFEAAIRDLSKVVGHSKPEAYLNRGFAYYSLRQYGRAIDDFRKYKEEAPQDPRGYMNLAAAFMDQGLNTEAIGELDDGLRRLPDQADLFVTRGEAKRLAGDLDGALSDYDEASHRNPELETLYNNRALAHSEKGEADQAFADFAEAILIAPTSARAYYNRGDLHRRRGNLDAALKDLNKALALNARSPEALTFRGETYLVLGQTQAALKDFNAALEVVRNFAPALVGRAAAFEKVGDKDKARRDYDAALSTPEHVDGSLSREAHRRATEGLAALAEAPKTVVSAPTPQPALPPVVDEPPVELGRRVALVIGNSSYVSVQRLPNPRGDAEHVAAALRKVGFQSVILVYDQTREQLLRALRDFTEEVDKADWAMVYYAGHGIQINGVNYIIPVDARLKADRDVADEAIPLERILGAIEPASRLRLVVLDACRDNPFERQMRRTVATRSVGRGLARIEPEGGTMVAFAAKDGEVALDGDDGNSPFVRSLVQHIVKPRIEVNMLFRMVRDDVLAATGRRQEPFVYGSLPGESFYFVPR